MNWEIFLAGVPATLVGVSLELTGLWLCWRLKDKAIFTGYMLANLLIASVVANQPVGWSGLTFIPGQMPMVFASLGLLLASQTMGRIQAYRIWRACVLILIFNFLLMHRFDTMPDLPGYDVAEHYRAFTSGNHRAHYAVMGSFIYVGGALQLLWRRFIHQPPWITYIVTMFLASVFGSLEFTTVTIYGTENMDKWSTIVLTVLGFRMWMTLWGLLLVVWLIHKDHVRANGKSNKGRHHRGLS